MKNFPKGILVGAIILLTQFATAQTFDEWKAALEAAKDRKGPESIPYSSLREEAKTKQEKMNELCKTDAWTCDGLETKSLREEIKGRTANIEDRKNEVSKLKSDLSNAKTDDEKKELQNKIDAQEKELETKVKELEFKQTSLKTDLSDIDIRIEKGNKCLEARDEVQKVYDNAKSKAGAETDPEKKEIASQLITYWETRKAEHDKIYNDVKGGLDKCKKCKDGDL
jgi:DNA repair exonuclease SbcCD ATPase subunit